MSLESLRHSALKNVPPEVICLILDSLEIRDLLRCTRVNKYLRGVVYASSSLVYKIRLSFAHYYDAQPKGRIYPSVSKRLGLLQQREDNWRNLKWSHKTPVPIGLNGSIYEFIGGVYGYGKDEERLVNGDLAFFALPVKSPRSGDILPLQQWSHTMPESNNVLDFSIDPSQDLLILVGNAPPENLCCYEVQLYSLTTSKCHPLAPDPILYSVLREDMATFSDENGPIRVQVSGDHLAFLVKDFILDGGARLQIWNWKAGSRHSCVISRTQQIDDFIFLSRHEILVVSPDGHFEVYTFPDPLNGPGKVTTRAVFALPRPAPEYRYWYISLAANPSHGYVSEAHDPSRCAMLERYLGTDKSITGNAYCPHCLPYQPKPLERILSCCLYVWKPEELEQGRVFSFIFFAPVRVFLDYLRFQQSADPFQPIPWQSWGPENTRWFYGDVTSDWNHGVYGCRALDATVSKPKAEDIVLSPVAATNGTSDADSTIQNGETIDDMINAPPIAMRHLRLRDFNANAVATAAASDDSQATKNCRIITTPSTLSGRGVIEDITSSLPYIEVVTEEAFEITDVMLDEARILLMKRTLDGQLRGLEILTM